MKITIDGRAIDVSEGTTVLVAARRCGIDIPSLCDHTALEPFGACRICLVEIRGRRGYSPACATPVEDGMDVISESPALAALRRGILELILSEHPAACLVCAEKTACDEFKATLRKMDEVTGCVHCPANGRCALQRVADRLGVKVVPDPARRRDGEVRRDDPFIDRDNSLCILCGRCVRVCGDVRGASVLTFVGRGSETVVDTAFSRRMIESGCQFCGACVYACPTGSLAERAARAALCPDRSAAAICPLCAMGCALDVHSREGRILFAAPSPEGPANCGQACVKGRFALAAALAGGDRILRPYIRMDGKLVPAEWDRALDAAAALLKKIPGRETAFILSADAPLGELYALAKWGAASKAAFSVLPASSPPAAFDRSDAELNFSLDEIGAAGTIVLLGLDPPVSHPLVWLEIRRALNKGAKLISVGDLPQTARLHLSGEIRTRPGREAAALNVLARAVLAAGVSAKVRARPGFDTFRAMLEALPAGAGEGVSNEDALSFAAALCDGDGPAVFLAGNDVFIPAADPATIASISNLALLAGARLIPLAAAANERGWLAVRESFGAAEKPEEEIRAGVRAGTIRALFVSRRDFDGKGGRPNVLIGQGSRWNSTLRQADVVFPMTTSLEAAGSFMNAEGRIQAWTEALPPVGEAKPGWEIAAALARRCDLFGFGYDSAADIVQELEARITARPGGNAKNRRRRERGFRAPLPSSFGPIPETDGDRPYILKATPPPDLHEGRDLAVEISGLRRLRRPGTVRMNPDDAAREGIGEGETVILAAGEIETRAEAALEEGIPPGVLRTTAGESPPPGPAAARVRKVR